MVTSGFNPQKDYTQLDALANELNNLPSASSPLYGRVSSYVPQWDSADGWVQAAAVLVAVLQPELAPLALFDAKTEMDIAGMHAEQAAQDIDAYLTNPANDELLGSSDGQDIDLIGHSRGAAVNARLSQLLTAQGYNVAQYVSLDGYSTDWPVPSGLLGDISIVGTATAQTKINYEVQNGLGQVLAQFLLPAGIVIPQSELATLALTLTSWRAPDRTGFDNVTIAGTGSGPNAYSDHLNIVPLFASDSTQQISTQLSDLYADWLQYMDGGADANVAEQPVSAESADAAPAPTVNYSNFNDGSLAALGSLWSQFQGASIPSDNGGLIDQWKAMVDGPAQLLAAEWETTGDARLVVSGGQPQAELTLSQGTASIGQYLELGNDASTVDFDLSVLSSNPGDRLEILFNGQAVGGVDLSGISGTRHESLPLSTYAGQNGTVSFQLVGSAGDTAAVTLDNLNIVKALAINPVPDQTVSAGDTLTIDVTVTDPNASKSLRYSLAAGAPSGASIDAASGVLTWTPTSEQIGLTYIIPVAVTDTSNLERTASAQFAVTVYPPGGGVPVGMTLGQANWFYQNTFAAPASVAPEWNGSVADGDAGTLGTDYLNAIAARIDDYRWMAGLPGGITLDPTENADAQQAALMMSANGLLDHDPLPGWIDYSAAGAQGAASSNLSLGASGTDAIDGYISDAYNISDPNSVGHRLWLLDPTTRTMGIGDIPTPDYGYPQANAVWVIQSDSPPAPYVSMVAWRPAGFVPDSLIPAKWSIQTDQNADFSNATVSMTKNGVPEQVTILSISGLYAGPAITWAMDGSTIGPAVYTVDVDNVMLNGQYQSFSYTTTSFDPTATTQLDPVPTQVGFLEPAMLVQATSGSVTIEVARSMGDDGPVSVDYTTADGSALAGVNYEKTSGVLSFQTGQFYQSITIPIIPSFVPAIGATFSVVLSSPTGAAFGQYSRMNFTISTPRPVAAPTVPGFPGGVSTWTGVSLAGYATPSSTILVYDGATQVGTTTSGTDGEWFFSATGLWEGVHWFNVKVEDALGNISLPSPAVEVTVEYVPPAPDSSVPSDGFWSMHELQLRGLALPGYTVLAYDGNTFLGETTAQSNGFWGVTATGLSSGVHSFTYVVEDGNGDLSPPSTPLVVTVNYAPLVTIKSMRLVKLRVEVGTGKRKRGKTETGLQLRFSGVLAGTSNPDAYQLLAGTTKKGATTFGKPVPLSVFRSTTSIVTLLPARKLNLSRPERLTITAADLFDTFGRPFNGGTNWVLAFSGKGVITVAQVRSQSKFGTFSASAADAVPGSGLTGSARAVHA